MVKDIKQTVVSHDDWFKPVTEIAGCRYLRWGRERFSFSVSYDAEVVRRLQGSAFLQQRLWGPAAAAYNEMISAIAVDAKVADNRIRALVKAFEADQDWPRFFRAARAEREAFSAMVLATQKITIARMKGEIDRVWLAKVRHDRTLQSFRMRVLIENDLRAHSVNLQLADLKIEKAGELTDWQNTVKTVARPCFDLGQYGRGLDTYLAEILAEVEALRGVIKAGRQAMTGSDNRQALLITLIGHVGVARVQRINKKLRYVKSKILSLQDSTGSARAGMADTAKSAARVLAGGRHPEMVGEIEASQATLGTLEARIGTIDARIKRCADFEAMARKAIEAIVNAADLPGTDHAIRMMNETLKAGAAFGGSGADDWENLNQSASQLIGNAVAVGRLHSRIGQPAQP